MPPRSRLCRLFRILRIQPHSAPPDKSTPANHTRVFRLAIDMDRNSAAKGFLSGEEGLVARWRHFSGGRRVRIHPIHHNINPFDRVAFAPGDIASFRYL